jgi:dolichol-phosphate mannosyltransferase
MTELLWVVLPAYNEEEALPKVLAEWVPVLRSLAPSFKICALDDGSRDGTGAVLDAAGASTPELVVVHKANSGHGQSCVDGYRRGLAAGADWILQIDSDGQCDAAFFEAVWRARQAHPVIYGFRRWREDGRIRTLISRVLSATVWIATGTWVRDSNVPYRLMRADAVAPVVDQIPTDFHLANVLVSVLQQRRPGIHWVDIRFRERIGGVPSVKTIALVRHGVRLFRQFRSSNAAETKTAERGVTSGTRIRA